MKDLSCLSKDLSRVVIVDNSPFSFLLQPLNGIPCVPFSARLPYDEQVGILSAFKNLTFLMPKNLINFISVCFCHLACAAFGCRPSTHQKPIPTKGC